MKNQKLYEDWKAKKSQIEVGDDFAEKVMQQVARREHKKSETLLNMQSYLSILYNNPLVRVGAIMAGFIAGVVRMAFAFYMLLGT